MKCKILQVLAKLTVQRQTRAFYQTEKKNRLRWLVLTSKKKSYLQRLQAADLWQVDQYCYKQQMD